MDNAAHQHLLVNHLPIIAGMLAVPMLVLTLILRKERGLLLASVFLLVATAGGALASMSTGEDAETMFDNNDSKEWYEPFSEADISVHEERAEHATWWFAVPTAAVSLVVLVLAHLRKPENPLSRWWIALLLVGAVLTAVGMAYAGQAGGVIMHREIRGDSIDKLFSPKDEEKK